ncbi:transcription initiation factor TFIID subunit 2-like isoform X2 [Tubulanus polymorphus]|uniref:transcription initiation factor TFIID subunit 2-like isoform X2 n=1 Tax=Tubulanus polymorphus TaxID=672921 RepID=UPI003DA2AE7E
MKKDGKGGDGSRPYRLAHQTLCLTGVNFENKSLVGYVEMQLHPMKTDLRRIKINCKQCRIYRISINDFKVEQFLYNDPALEICQGDIKQRNLDFFESCHATAVSTVDPNKTNGEITIRIPPDVFPCISGLGTLRVNIEFSLENPKGGIQFVVPNIEGSLSEKAAHFFSYGYENSSRLWFPCIDTYSEPCTWKLEYTVGKEMTAVSCGDLIEVIYTPDMKRKTFHYFLSTPTPAPNIGLAVGPFEILVDKNMHEVTHFCLPHLMPILKQSTAFLHEAFEFYEELLSVRYPYSVYKQVFVDQAYSECQPYATMTVFSVNLLHSSAIIDQTMHSRKTMAVAVAKQFFGCFIPVQTWCDAWLVKGISGYLGNLYVKKAFGNNEYRFAISRDLKKVQNYEKHVCGIVLDPSANKESCTYFPIKHAHTVSPRYIDVFILKAQLVIRMLELRIGRELILQVFNKLLSMALLTAQQKFMTNTWANLLLSTSSFTKCISLVTGKDIQPFLDQWVLQSGCARFSGTFVFNRKRNVVELDLKQDMNAKGSMKYVGPLTVTIQELDGSFNHTFKIEENKTRFEITCHSKSRRNKKKKIPLMTGEEIDMDLSAMEADSPVLWLRCDPEMEILREVGWEQPDFMWQYQVRYERDVVAQSEAVHALQLYPTPQTRIALTDTIESDQCFYRVRMEASFCLSRVANSMAISWSGPPAMMTIFRKMFGSHACPTIVKQNNFTNFQHYFLQKTIPVAMAMLRDTHNICPIEVLTFLLDLLKYTDNVRNKFSDNYYRAALIDALMHTLTPAVATVSMLGPSVESLSNEARLVLDEIVRYLNLEKLLPCYRYTVTVSCLQAIRKMQKYGHLPNGDYALFQSYASYGNFLDVRLAALEALVDYTKVEKSNVVLNWLLEIIENDPESYVKHQLLLMLIEKPPFERADDNNPLNTEELVHRLWRFMNALAFHDARLRCDIADLYFTLYGRSRPAVLPIPENVMVLNYRDQRLSVKTSQTSILTPTALKKPQFKTFSPMDYDDEEDDLDIDVDACSPAKSRKPELILKRKSVTPIRIETSPLTSSTSRELHVKTQSDSPKVIVEPMDVSVATEEVVVTSALSPKKSLTSPPAAAAAATSQPDTTPTTESFIQKKLIEHESTCSSDTQQSVTFKHEDSVSRLSDDSSASSAAGGGDDQMIFPTSFQGQLFPTKLSLSMDDASRNKDFDDSKTSASTSKPHKAKKKKKKNKHKHKHKHKHDKPDKFASEKHEEPKSADPYDFGSASSPDFEVM